MKNVINLLLICLLGLSLTSCGSKDNEAGDVTIAPPPGGNGNGNGNGDGLGNGNLDPWNNVTVDLSSVVSWRYQNTYDAHVGRTTKYVRPKVDGNRSVNMNDRRWTPVAVGDFSYQVEQTSQLPVEVGMIITKQRLYFKKVDGFNRSTRCAVIQDSTMTVADVYRGSMVTSSYLNEFKIDKRSECSGFSPIVPFNNGFYQRDLNEYYESYNANSILSRLSNIQVERLEVRNANKFYKVKGVMFDNDFQQNLSHEFLFMLARGQYRVILVKKYNAAGKLVDSAYNQYDFERNPSRLRYNNSRVQTWNWGFRY